MPQLQPSELSPQDVAEIGLALFGEVWVPSLADALGVAPPTAYGYRDSGATGRQALALIGLLARTLHSRRLQLAKAVETHEERTAALGGLLDRLEAKLSP